MDSYTGRKIIVNKVIYIEPIAIHAFKNRLYSLTHILNVTPFTRNEVNDITSFTVSIVM
jgi:hypothetical protein